MTLDTGTGREPPDRAALGIIYGGITALGILMAVGGDNEAPFAVAAMLFASILAVALARAFCSLLAQAREHGKRAEGQAWRAAWRHARPTLVMPNVPTLLFLTAGAGAIRPQTALILSQMICVLFLMGAGGREALLVGRSALPAALGALLFGAIGLALVALSFILH